MEESIYNIIPAEYVAPVKPALYRSKHSHKVMPTGSTFCHKNTVLPGVSNMGGNTGFDKHL